MYDEFVFNISWGDILLSKINKALKILIYVEMIIIYIYIIVFFLGLSGIYYKFWYVVIMVPIIVFAYLNIFLKKHKTKYIELFENKVYCGLWIIFKFIIFSTLWIGLLNLIINDSFKSFFDNILLNIANMFN